VLRFKGVEADDIAAYIVKHYSQDYNHTWLISSDKDWDLLIKDDVSRFTTHSRKEITLNNWGTHYSYPPHQHISVKAITGDSGDNVAGVPGIGEKRAAGLLREYESALDVHAALPIPGSQKFIQSLNEFKDNILINYELMDLLTYCDVAVLDNTEEIDEVMNG
jgi:5'-3' exonuclease